MSYHKLLSVGIFLLVLGTLFSMSCNQRNKLAIKDKNNLTERRIDSLFHTAVEKQEIPGAVALIKHKDSIKFHKAYGYRNIQTQTEQQKDDLFRLASMTKGLTAAAILQLNEKGLLGLDDKIDKYIPEFSNLMILDTVYTDSSFRSHPATKKITVRQLLTHSSGIGYGFQNENYNKLIVHNLVSEGFCSDTRTSMENTHKIAALPLLQEPGSSFIYSLSYDVLGTLIEVVSGIRYDKYIESYLLEPLEMHDSYFIIPAEERSRLVSVYQPSKRGDSLIQAAYSDIDYPIIDNKEFFSGGADLCGTAEDYSHFIQMIMDKGTYKGKRVLSSESVAKMLSKQTDYEDGGSDQGFAAWVINEKGAESSLMTTGSFEFGGFFDTYSWADPNLEFNAVLLLQMYPNNNANIHHKYQKLVYEMMNKINQ
jgi:CubicO group peptidase (beta-lactamase class C family)